MESKKRLVVVPRWAGTPEDDWYPWLTKKLTDEKFFSSIIIAAMPNPSKPTIEAWTSALSDIMGDDINELKNTILVGHSIGCHAALHYLAALPPDYKIAELVCVAGWWDIENPWEDIKPWITHAHDCDRIKKATSKTHVLISDNDPYTPNYKVNTHLWQKYLNAQVYLINQAKHFNASKEPAVHDLLQRLR